MDNHSRTTGLLLLTAAIRATALGQANIKFRMNMKQLSFLLSFFLLLSCGGKKSGDQTAVTEVKTEVPEFPQTVPFETGIETERKVLMSEIADSIRLIPLETNDKSLIKRLMAANILQTKEYLFLPWLEKLFQFTKDGKFIRTIGRKGNGPGEFTWISQIDVDEEKGLVYMLTTSAKINIYEMETGKFIRAMKVPNLEASEFVMLPGQDTIAATFVRNNNGRRKERIYLSDLNGDTLRVFNRWDLFELNSQYSWMMSGDADRYMFRYKDNACYKEYYNDTLFTITRNTLEPRYIFQLGKYSLPMEYRFEYLDGNGKRFQELAAPYLQYDAIETDSYIFMPYSNWAGEKARENQLAIYDKNGKNCFKVTGGHIENDLLSSLPFRPMTALDSHTLIGVWNPDEIFKKAEKDPSLLEIEQLKGLKEDDNPVLMLVYLKQP